MQYLNSIKRKIVNFVAEIWKVRFTFFQEQFCLHKQEFQMFFPQYYYCYWVLCLDNSQKIVSIFNCNSYRRILSNEEHSARTIIFHQDEFWNRYHFLNPTCWTSTKQICKFKNILKRKNTLNDGTQKSSTYGNFCAIDYMIMMTMMTIIMIMIIIIAI